MNRSQIESALERNLPFSLRMADGKKYPVPHRDYISLPPRGAFVVVYDESEHVFVLPLLTMTGLTYQAEGSDAQKHPTSQQRRASNRSLLLCAATDVRSLAESIE
jgi:hypothetical protein